MTALDPVVLLARQTGSRSFTLYCENTVLDLHSNLFSRQPRDLGNHLIVVRRLEEVDRRSPACGPFTRQGVESFLQSQQIAERIPMRKCHAES